MSGTVSKKVYNMFERRQSIPIIYVRGTHYDVGYDVVRKWNLLFAEYFAPVLCVFSENKLN